MKKSESVPSVPADERLEGNTITSSPAKKWCFTLNNYSESEYNDLIDYFSSKCSSFIIGKEKGESGTPHLQGYFCLKDKLRWTAIKKINNRLHFEVCKGNEEANFKYCSKEGDYIQKGLDKYINPKSDIPDDIIKMEDMRPFQKDIINMALGEPQKGKIIWIYDPIGQLGKTEILRHLHIFHHIPFAFGGKCADIMNLAFNNKDYLTKSSRPCFMYNIARDDNTKISYASMEQLSDGCIANTKFEANCFVFKRPSVIVLANILPDMNKLTKSRWIIKTINKTSFTLEDYKIISLDDD